jgi:hypothetical protein
MTGKASEMILTNSGKDGGRAPRKLWYKKSKSKRPLCSTRMGLVSIKCAKRLLREQHSSTGSHFFAENGIPIVNNLLKSNPFSTKNVILLGVTEKTS